MFLAKTLSFYKRRDIQEELIKQAKDKEIAFRFGDFFGKRPDILAYPADVLELAKQKLTSLHCSEELWTNPLQISVKLKKDDINALRKGWDLILDIDCKLFEYSKITAFYAVKALRAEGVTSISIKFSGNKGFHIGVPFEAFPEKIGEDIVKDLFPEAPRRIAAYITDKIKNNVAKAIFKIEKNDFSRIMKRTGFSAKEITRYEKNEFGDNIPMLNIDPFLEIDTLLISSRHLYRMPYSFHEKSELISIPINPDKILSFKKQEAKPENVKIQYSFLDRNIDGSDAERLLRNAFDHNPQMIIEAKEEERKRREKTNKHFELPEKAIGEEYFPPCILKLLKGIEDGRKRTVFILINFLASCGWDYDMIEDKLREWNEKNHEPLREQCVILRTVGE